MKIEWPDIDDFDAACGTMVNIVRYVALVVGAIILGWIIYQLTVVTWPMVPFVAGIPLAFAGLTWIVALVQRNYHARVNNRSANAEKD